MDYTYEELEDGTIAIDVGKLYVDEEDVKMASNIYIMVRSYSKEPQGYKSLGRVIMNPPKGLVVDHINQNGLDNRKSNLRVCTYAENNDNRRGDGEVCHEFKKEDDGSYSLDIGKVLIDKEDIDKVGRLQFTFMKKYRGRSRSLYRIIMDAKDGEQVDHIDGNRLNNRRSNLRICTQFENSRNIKIVRGVSKYKGVSWKNRISKWSVSIRINKKRYHLGDFVNEIEAARTYDVFARELHKEFAVLNFPDLPPLDIDVSAKIDKINNRKMTSKYLGVSFHAPANKWRSQYNVNKKQIILGYFTTEEEAYQARKKFEEEHLNKSSPGV
jgi:hypothetical protein